MTRPAFIVDGDQEQKIIQKICAGAPVRKLGCNGRDVKLEVAAKKIASLIRLIGNKYYPFIIVFDRENRVVDSDKIRKTLTKLVRGEGISDLIIIAVPDRMIENWILADSATLKRNGYKFIKRNTEGLHGKSEIKRVCPENSIYHETIEGVDLFVKCSARIIYKNSPSFKRLMDELKSGNVGHDCGWAKGLL